MDSKLGKVVVKSASLVAIASGVNYLSKRVVKTSFTNDPSNSIENYGKWVAVLTAAIYARDYLQKEKILPD